MMHIDGHYINELIAAKANDQMVNLEHFRAHLANTTECDSTHKVYFAGRDGNDYVIYQDGDGACLIILSNYLEGVFGDVIEISEFDTAKEAYLRMIEVSMTDNFIEE